MSTAAGTSSVTLPIKTDNKGNTYSVKNYKAKRWPNAPMLMELALIDHHTGSRPDISHTLRETNKWSDQLTHRDFKGFDMNLRFDPEQGPWHIFGKLIQNYKPETRQRTQPLA